MNRKATNAPLSANSRRGRADILVRSSIRFLTGLSISPTLAWFRVAADRNVRAPAEFVVRGSVLSRIGLPRATQNRHDLCQGLLFCLLLVFCCGCASPPRPEPAIARRFDFARDTFAYPNELVWEYRYDANGKWTTRRRETRPSYSQHCFVVSRSVCQFFENAVFEPELPMVDDATYHRLVRRLIFTNPRTPLPENQKVVFPGFADLRSFSQAHERLLKAECGGAWQCYFQRGNWRILFPFSRHQQQHVAEELTAKLRWESVAVVHLVRFPQLSINHAVLMFDAKESPKEIQFSTYDPNQPDQPVTITFNRSARTFYLAPNNYFPGGRVDVYPIYDRLIY
jgi:hypothetical protein